MTRSTMEIRLRKTPEEVWALVTDLGRWDWRSDLDRIEVTGADTFVEVTKDGFETAFTVTAAEPPARWAFDMDNENMRGRWSGSFTKTAEGVRLVFTEDVEAKKWWMRPFVKGYLKKQQAQYAADLRRALGEQRGGLFESGAS